MRRVLLPRIPALLNHVTSRLGPVAMQQQQQQSAASQPQPQPSAATFAATAPLPRQLNVQQFAAARDPELQGLWASLEGLGRLAADQLLLRHLRRRATSHRRYLCRRRPNAALAKHAPVHSNDAAAAGTPAAGDASSTGASRRPLNRLQRRRPALLQQAAVDSSSHGDSTATATTAGNSSSPPSAATPTPVPTRLETHVWHARRMRMTCCWGHVLTLGAFGRGRGSRSLLHQALRRPGLSKPTSRFHTLAAAGGPNPRSSAAAAAGPSGAAATAAGTPVAAADGGKQAAIRAVVHDASYWQCLQLQGHQQQLTLLLEAMTDAHMLQARVLQHAGVLAGAAEVQVLLHHPGNFPAGAIGPVKLMWHPPAARKQQQQQQGMDVDAPVRTAPEQQQQQGGRRQRKQQLQQQQEHVLWLWVHAAYAAEAQAALLAGIEQQQEKEQQHVRPVALTRVSLRRLELTGPSADGVIRSVITQQRQQHGVQRQQQQPPAVQQQQQPHAPAAPGGGRPAHNAVWQALTAAPLSRWSLVPDGAVLGLAAVDPRLVKPCRHAGLCDLPPHLRAPGAAGAATMDAGASSSDAAAATAALTQLRQHWPANGRRWWGPGRPLMSNPAAGTAAAPEVAVSTWRQQQQAAALLGPGLGVPGWRRQQQLSAAASGQRGSRSRVGRAVPLSCALDAGKVSAYGITSRIGERSSTQEQEQQESLQQQQQAEGGSDAEDIIMFDAGPDAAGNSTAAADADRLPPPPHSAAAAVTAVLPSGCRVLLVRQAGCTAAAAAAAAAGWSLLLPAGWVMPFWQALTHAGAKPAGLREWAWIAAAAQQHLPPLDYPDTAAAAASAAALHAEALAAAGTRPLGRWAWHSSRRSSSSSQAPCVDWRLLGRQLLLPTAETSMPAAAGSNVGGMQQQQQEPESSSMPSMQHCWAAAVQLQAAAAAVKRHRQRHRGRVKQQERARQQQQPPQPAPPAAAPVVKKQLSSQKALRERVRAKLLEQQQQLSQSLLLPPGSYVARSWRVLLAALPTAAPVNGSCQPSAAGRVLGVPASVLAAGRRPNRRLAAALQQGRLAWAPVTSSSSLLLGAQAALAAAAAAAGDGGAAAMEVDAAAEAGGPAPAVAQQDTSSSSSAQCLVRVSVRVLGKGRCKAGAAILVCGSTAAAAATLATATLLGYVTVAVPRGAGAQLYPGGLGFCSGPALWRLRAQDARPASARVLRAWLLNPGSSVLRRVQLSVVFEGEN